MRRPESAEGMRSLLAPTEAALTHLELLKTRSCDDRSDLKNHLQMLCGACSALGWVTTTDPKAYVRFKRLPAPMRTRARRLWQPSRHSCGRFEIMWPSTTPRAS